MVEVDLHKSDLRRTIGLLGGEKVIRAEVRNAIDAHELLLKGLPAVSLVYLVRKVSSLERGDTLQKAIGLSMRTLQRHKAGGSRSVLSVEQSNRTWRFAEVFDHATEVMGSEEAAEEWINQPAIGLSNRKPVDLLATSAGVEAVEEYLTRLEYGVYA